tara:strand:- start:44561 stop:45415 length:855 start_codon:yes stop_codon:yes gene_type:complete
MSSSQTSLPTSELYESFQFAYDFFNRHLFESKLPEVIFTFQRKAGSMGFFAPDRWGNLNGKKCHEIAMNPSYIANCRLIEVMKTLVHEMCHCWQYSFGSPARSYYHNKEWAMKMIQVGLMPSTTGEPGGQITGQQMSDYIIEGGIFLKAFEELKVKEDFQLRWIDKLALPRLYDPIIAPLSNNNVHNEQENSVSTVNIMTIDPETKLKEEKLIKPFNLESDDHTYVEEMPEYFFVKESAPRKTRNRYVCGCGNRVYGKPGLQISCRTCGQDFIWQEYQNKNGPN